MRLPHRFQGQKFKSQGGAGAYCGGDLAAQLVLYEVHSSNEIVECTFSIFHRIHIDTCRLYSPHILHISFMHCLRPWATSRGTFPPPPLENVKTRFASIKTFWFAQKQSKLLPPDTFHWLKLYLNMCRGSAPDPDLALLQNPCKVQVGAGLRGEEEIAG